uniref:uncharacterized protein LOC122598627 n=1 Tax=Erigeron canadensis TaxID=72917 RepID=UPI001CB95613|nr:uncharacterized protein LOC122598627 [Erigeron canadensis]
MADVNAFSGDEITGKASLDFVMSYLLHGCFEETITALNGSTPYAKPTTMEIAKKEILERVRLDDAIGAVNVLEKEPGLLNINPTLLCDLLCIHFIKLISSGNRYMALKFAEMNFIPLLELKDNVENIQACTKLLYEKPELIHSMSSILNTEFRQKVSAIQARKPLDRPSTEEWENMRIRKGIMKFVLDRNEMKAIASTKKFFRGLLEKNSEIEFELLRLHLLTLIYSEKPSEAIKFARTEFSHFDRRGIHECMLLLLYPNPDKGTRRHHLISTEHREDIADKLNRAILAYGNCSTYSTLERLMQHVIVSRKCVNEKLGKGMSKEVSIRNLFNEAMVMEQAADLHRQMG